MTLSLGSDFQAKESFVESSIFMGFFYAFLAQSFTSYRFLDPFFVQFFIFFFGGFGCLFWRGHLLLFEAFLGSLF